MAVVNQSQPIALVLQGNDINNSTDASEDNASNARAANKANQANIDRSSFLNLAAATYYIGLTGTPDNYQWINDTPVNFSEIINSDSLDSLTNYYNNTPNMTAIAIYTYNQTYKLGDAPLTSANKNLIDTSPIIINQANQTNYQIIPNFSIVRDYFEWWKANQSSQNIIQYNQTTDKYKVILQSQREWNEQTQSYELVPEQELNNFQYLDGDSANKMATLETSLDPNQPNEWRVDNDKYWLQLQVPSNFNLNVISFLNTYLTGTQQSIEQTDYFIDQLKKSPVNIWTTFKQNFLFGQFMKISSEFKAAILLNMVPNLVSQTLATGITDILNSDDHNHPSYYFSATNSPLMVANNTTIPLVDNQKYAFYNQHELATIKSFSTNLTNIPSLANVSKTLVGDKNSFTNDISEIYLKAISYSNFYKNFINSVINATIIDAVYSKPIKLNDEQLKTIFGTPTGIQALFELNGNLLANLNKGSVSIPGTEVVIPWGEFSLTFIENLKKNVGLIPLINHPSSETDYTNLVVAKNDLNQRLGTNISSWMGFLSSGASKIENLDNIVTSSIQGSQFAVYGIGLGEFFVCIGIWVGILMQTFVFDRDIRRPKQNQAWTIGKHSKNSPQGNKWARYHDATAWWFAKNSLMSLTTVIQVTFLMMTIGLLGWFQIGPSFGLLYLSILFTALIWTAFIQSLWFLFRDEVVGKFIVILFLIVNITSGWGTFPPVMQFKFFQVISHIAPFTYCIHNQGLIIYGVAVNGQNYLDTMAILKYSGIQLIYLAIGYILSIYEGMNLQKITFFGSANAKHVGEAIALLDNQNISNELLITTTNKKHQVVTKVNWDALDWTYDQTIANATISLYPSIKNFKKYTKKHDCVTYSLVE